MAHNGDMVFVYSGKGTGIVVNTMQTWCLFTLGRTQVLWLIPCRHGVCLLWEGHRYCG